MSSEKFITPTFKGKRFDDHQLPIEVLGEFKAYRDFVLALAKRLYLKAHQNENRQRVPNGFADQLQLRILSISEGSAAVQVDRYSPDDGKAHPEFEKGRDLINMIISSPDGNIPEEFPMDLLSYFEAFGRTLQDDESIELTVPNTQLANATYTKARRLKLLERAHQPVDAGILLHGRISQVDVHNKRFTLLLEDQTEVDGVFHTEIGTFLIDALQRYEYQEAILVGKARVFGMSINRIDRVQHITIYDEGELKHSIPDLGKQVTDIKALEKGWLDGVGTAFEPSFVDSVVHALDKIREKTVPYPYIYPTETGAIQVEWSFGDWEVSIVFDKEAALLHAAKMSSEETVENRFEGWAAESVQSSIADFLLKKFVEINL